MRQILFSTLALLVMVVFHACETTDEMTGSMEDSSVIWYGEITADSLARLGVTTLKYSIENEAAGTVDASVFYVNAPDCGGSNVMTVSRDLNGAASSFYGYSIKDQNDVEIWSGDVFISSIVCSTLEVFF